ncbi:MAG: RNase adapter RapZ [Ostreibacterium sp.]
MIIVSGLSGAGKTVALHILEDLGYYCIDNLPASLLTELYNRQLKKKIPVAVGIDIRNQIDNIDEIPHAIEEFKQKTPIIRILFLNAQTNTLIERFNASQRKHPLATPKTTLKEAIQQETSVLSHLYVTADYQIDTSNLSIYDLKDRIQNWLQHSKIETTTITIESFGFKNGTPHDADLLFDVRFLPNPYWQSTLREFTGQDKIIQDYLKKFDISQKFIDDTVSYLAKWLPTYLTGYRSYLTIGIGCTGGKHRSVFVCEQIAQHLSKQFGHINIRHRDLPK